MWKINLWHTKIFLIFDSLRFVLRWCRVCRDMQHASEFLEGKYNALLPPEGCSACSMFSLGCAARQWPVPPSAVPFSPHP